ncbi:MAG: hypothetical protein J3K34DRAFT_59747 [Monoraphidium minutum]|nr:MAG: hypothetical protein J3K34DRAFT_59747 [Monoraphidium minutum]
MYRGRSANACPWVGFEWLRGVWGQNRGPPGAHPCVETIAARARGRALSAGSAALKSARAALGSSRGGRANGRIPARAWVRRARSTRKGVTTGRTRDPVGGRLAPRAQAPSAAIEGGGGSHAPAVVYVHKARRCGGRQARAAARARSAAPATGAPLACRAGVGEGQTETAGGHQC